MSDEVFRPQPPGPQPVIQGTPPPAFAKMMQEKRGPVLSNTPSPIDNGVLRDMIAGLKANTAHYEEILLPSKGRFYDGADGPEGGVLHVRPMVGEEEQILATPQFVRKGTAMNMIFSRCLREQFKPENLLSADRTYLLIYLRGISYGLQYEVNVRCEDCDKKFSTTLDLDQDIEVEYCPDDFNPPLEAVMPTSGLSFTYRLSTGRDELQVQQYRDRRVKDFGSDVADDTLSFRMAQLVTSVTGPSGTITDKQEIQRLAKALHISDVAFIRNTVTEPPFGVNTRVQIICPVCQHDFDVEMPLEANFFFPRRRKEKTPALPSGTN